jgi:hypothetical protein
MKKLQKKDRKWLKKMVEKKKCLKSQDPDSNRNGIALQAIA